MKVQRGAKPSGEVKNWESSQKERAMEEKESEKTSRRRVER